MRLILKELGANVRPGVSRFPEAVFLAVAWGIVAICVNHSFIYRIFAYSITPDLERMLYVLALGFPVFLCVRVFFERIPRMRLIIKMLIYILAVLGLLAYYYSLFPRMDLRSDIRHLAYNIFFYLAFTFIPYFFRREHYEHYAVKLISRFALTGFFALVAMHGPHINGDVSQDVVHISIVFAVILCLAGVPEPQHQLKPEDYPELWKVLLFYVALPLLIAYAVLLYVYFCKIIITWQWPDMGVDVFVLWFVIISAFAVFFVHPLRTADQWLDKFVSYFPKIVLPLFVLMFIAIYKHIDVYSITAGRYFILLAGGGHCGVYALCRFQEAPAQYCTHRFHCRTGRHVGMGTLELRCSLKRICPKN